MEIHELNREQLIELKQAILFNRLDKNGECPSYGEIADVNELISDEEVYETYAGTTFPEDDFMCSAGANREEEDE